VQIDRLMASKQPSSRLVPPGVERLLEALFPGSRLVDARPLRPDSAGEANEAKGRTAKAIGYGVPVALRLIDAAGDELDLVWRTASPNDFGHDRRSDRAQELLLAFDSFGRIPAHVPALDVGAILEGGQLASLRRAGEFYLLTRYAPGELYAADLRRIARDRAAAPRDLERAHALARYLVALHAEHGDRPAIYRRAIRDLVGHGEGIFGVIDSYPADTPEAPPGRLAAIERRCLDWRWRLRASEGRLRRTHGDFHPFNILFSDETSMTVLDTSRGSAGDPADDVAALALNYAWRGLVMASPAFYPALPGEARNRLLGFVEQALAVERFDPDSAEGLFR
jgi:aminoglycoside phosphotransferase (APT) family kinase protein